MAFGMISRPRPVLIVDDDAATLEAERQLLVESGFRVVQAHDGAEALRVVQEDPPALVVLDVQMPGMDGPSFARELRMALRRVPLVILTGVADPRREADRCNAEAFLSKPFDESELSARLRSLLRTKALQDRLTDLLKRYVSDSIAVGINLELVQPLSCEGLGGGWSRWTHNGRRVHVHDQD